MFGGGVISVVVMLVVVLVSAFAVVDGTVEVVTGRVFVAGNGGATSPSSGMSISASGGHVFAIVVGAADVVEEVSGTPGSTAGAA